MSMPVQGPTSPENHDTSGLHCRQALEIAFQEGAGVDLQRLADEALELGWSEFEVHSAIIGLVKSQFSRGKRPR
jgi:hypothetical protein